tara:strand:+ start:10669 stop:12570 length:1902 start_codon:yes stop_codon:yes gene_type:complete
MATLTSIRGLVDSAVDAATGGGGGGGAGITVYNTLASLPPSSGAEGSLAYVDDANKVYVSIGDAWFPMAVVNQDPTLSVSPEGIIILATDTTSTTVRLTATDADSGATLTFSVESDGNFGGLGTVSQDSSVFTITPKSQAAATTNFSQLTFRVSDGQSIASSQRTLRLLFGTGGPTYETIQETDLGAGGHTNQCGTNYAVCRSAGVMMIGNSYNPQQYGAFGWYQLVNGIWTYRSYHSINDVSGRTDQYYGTAYGAMACSRNYIFANYTATSATTYNKPYAWKINGSSLTGLSSSAFSTPANSSGNFSYSYGAPLACDSSGDIVILGQAQDGQNGGVSGVVSFYRRDDGADTWTEVQQFPSPQSGSNNQFGNALAMTEDGLTLAVGERNAEGPSPFSASTYGKVHVYTRDSAGSDEFEIQASIQPLVSDWDNVFTTQAVAAHNSNWNRVPNGVDANPVQWGHDIGISDDGNTLIIGGFPRSRYSTSNYIQGAALIYKRTGTTWNHFQTLHPVEFEGIGDPSSQNYDYKAEGMYFGTTVCINGQGNVVFIGAPSDTNYKTSGRSGVGGVGMFYSQDSSSGPFLARNWVEGSQNTSYAHGYVPIGYIGKAKFITDIGVASSPYYNGVLNKLYDSA